MGMTRTVGVAAVALAAALGIAAATQAAPAIQTLDASFKPSKLPKDDYANGAISVEVSAIDAANPAGLPPKATRAEIFFDDDGRINPKAVPTCSQGQLENTTTQAALDACGDAKVGTGTTVAALPFGDGGARVDFPGAVTAFNGEGKTVLLHARVDALGTTVVLPGRLRKGTGDIGTVLDVTVPPLAGGVGAIAFFEVTVKRGKYIQARCHDKNKTLNIDSRFTYSDAPQTTESDTQKCKVKKKR